MLDGIHTRMGASDSIQQGRSTFLEEMGEASNIIHTCTPRSLVIIDELGRGTSTHDGVAIAYATLHHLLAHKRCMVLFVTHYPKIIDIEAEFPGSVGAYHVSYLTSHNGTNVMESNVQNAEKIDHQDVTYLYKLVPGVSERSFGFKVAQLAQVNDHLLPLCVSRSVLMSFFKLKEKGFTRFKFKSTSNGVPFLLQKPFWSEDKEKSLQRFAKFLAIKWLYHFLSQI